LPTVKEEKNEFEAEKVASEPHQISKRKETEMMRTRKAMEMQMKAMLASMNPKILIRLV
jgi:uncharacterized membrane protein (DUF106 family)